MIKKLFQLPAILIIKLAYKNFDYKSHSIGSLVKCAFRQKLFGKNRKTPWPVHHTSTIICHEKIEPGSWAPGLSPNNYIDGRNGIIFNENVRLGPGISVISMNHDNLDYTKYIKDEPIRVGKNSWLAARCILLPGVQLGEHTIVAAGTVVTKSFPEGNQIIAGNPAKVIKKLELYSDEKHVL